MENLIVLGTRTAGEAMVSTANSKKRAFPGIGSTISLSLMNIRIICWESSVPYG